MKEQAEKKGKQHPRTEKSTFWGLVIGGFVGILGFWISGEEYFILSPFALGFLAFLGGLVVDKKEELERNRKIFKN